MHPLTENINAYNAMQDKLLEHHLGKFVLFYDGKFINAYDTFDTAATHAVLDYGRGPYLIRKVGQKDEVPLPASVAYRPIANAGC